MVGNASVVDALRDFGDKWYYLKLQSVWAAVGLVAFFVASRFPYRKLEKLAPLAMLVTVVLLLVVLIPGIGNKLLGARRWINVGSLTFQPAELAKITTAVYLASLLKKAREKFVPFMVVVVGLSGLIMLEPDLGTTVVLLGMSFLTYFGSGGKIRYLVSMIPVLLLVVGILIVVSPYRLNRLKSFVDFTHDTQGASYHIHQVLLSLGSGGVFGVGLGQSRQKYEFLPEVTTDSIFAVIGEELGMVGGIGVIGVYLWLISLGLKISRDTSDKFGSNLALAITCWIATQAFVNISAMVALVPLTGIPLPFVSYGGSALVILLLGSGILVSIGRSK